MIITHVAAMLEPVTQHNSIPAGQKTKPLPVGIVVRCTIIAVMVVIVISFYASHVIPGWITAASILLGLACIAGAICTGIRQAEAYQGQLSTMRAAGPLRATAPELRKAAEALTADTTVVTGLHRARPAEPYAGAHRAPYAPRHAPDSPRAARTATLPPPRPPAPHVEALRQRRNGDARLYRVAAILVTPCSACGAGEAETCKPIPGVQWYELDRARGLYAHSLRIARAIATGNAPLEDVQAQFKDGLPAEIWRTLL
jgi:hypothetical protein